MHQMSLLEDAVLSSYANGELSNADLYKAVEKKTSYSGEMKPIGKDKSLRNVLHQRLRWIQQSLKSKGFIKQVRRGHWELTNHKAIELRSIEAANKMVAMSTSLGVAIWAKSDSVFNNKGFNETIHLALTSPPYPLQKARAYGMLICT